MQDVQQYILHQLDCKPALHRHLILKMGEMLNQILHTRSNGCFLCLDWALDSTAAGATVLPEVWHIPSTATSGSASASSCCRPSPLPQCWVRAGG